MKWKMKRLLGLFLSLALVLGMFPGMSLTAYAAGTMTLRLGDSLEDEDYESNFWLDYYQGDVSIAEGTYVQINMGTWHTDVMEIYMNDEVVYTKPSGSCYQSDVYHFTAGKNCKILGGSQRFTWEDRRYVKITQDPSHDHSFTYSVNGATITAECSAADCPLTESKATLTIAAPELTTYGGTGSAAATLTGLTDFNSATGKSIAETDIKYIGRDGTTYAESTTAPTNAGKYTARITVEEMTASVNYEIAKVDPTAPTGLTATYGQKLADVTLPTGWTWVDSTQSVGSVVSPVATFKANFAGDDNYNAASNVDVTVTVSKAANPATVTGTATVTKGGNTVDLASNVTLNGATGEVAYAIDGAANGCSLSGSVLTSGENTGSVTVNVTVAADDNYNVLAATPITVTISDKSTQTIDASDVTATYGDTDKKVEATTDGNGAISYAVKEGSSDYIDVDSTTGALTIKKVGTATVIVTAAETTAYAQATEEVTVTINKANAVAASVTANNRSYDGTEKPLVTVTGEPTGGEMQYAIGDANGATQPYTTSIPTATNAGTYYVWYKVKGDENHNDSDADCVAVTIAKKTVTVKAENKSMVYGETEPELTYTSDGLVGDDTITGSLSREEGSNVGTYAINIGTLSVGDNYEIAFTPAIFTITSASSDTTAPTANELTYSGSDQALVKAGTPTGGTLVYSLDNKTWTEDVSTGKNAGSYTVYYKVKGDKNHSDTEAQAINVTILPKTLTVTADAKTKKAGESDPELTYTSDGLVEGDTISGTLTREEGETAGTYAITLGTLTAGDNYTINFVGANLTITAADAITYTNTKGAGSTWTKGSEGTLEFAFSRSVDDSETIKHFAGIKVDDKEESSENYTFKPGSVIINLKSGYLNSLATGDHTLTAMFDDGDDVTVEFTIKEKASEGEKKSDTTPNNKKADVTPGNKTTTKTDAPGTGDAVNLKLIFIVMILSMCDIFALCNLRSILEEKKRRR